MSPWTKFATSFYRKKKSTNKNYKFSQALKDAAEVYNGGNDVKMDGGNGDGDDENRTPGEIPLAPAAQVETGQTSDVPGAAPGQEETGKELTQGGKKSKKSAKKGKKSAKKSGKKSAKKGGKKARKSAKKRKC